MRRFCLLAGLILLHHLSAFATPDISMEVYRFNTESSPYIEVSVYSVGASMVCEKATGDLYGIGYIVLIKDTMDHIVAGDKFRLNGNGCPAKDIFDVRRFALKEGAYTVAIEAWDLTDSLSVINISQQIRIIPAGSSGSISDIQLASTFKSEPDQYSPFHKSGIYLEPLAFRFYYPSLHQLCVYLETYHADMLEGQAYLQYTVKPTSGDIPAPITSYKKVKKEPISANIFQLDISSLISGPYALEASLYDGNRQLKDTKTILFSRLNPEGDSIYAEHAASQFESGFVHDIPVDSLNYVLRAMAPVVNSLDNEILNTLVKKGSDKAKQYFIYRYWTARGGKLAKPAFQNYMTVARLVDQTFASGFGYGFETDRGHVFLKYGQPNDVITVEDEPSAPPYEIWFYNTFPTTHQTNVRFLFYNPSLTKNGFELLHSTARGEVNNARWEVELYRDATQETPGVNETEMGDNVHRNARLYFQN